MFCTELERKSTNHFNLHAALKKKLLNYYIHTPSGKTKKERTSYTNKKMENGKLKIQQPSSLTFPSQLLKFPSAVFTTAFPAMRLEVVSAILKVVLCCRISTSPQTGCVSENWQMEPISLIIGVLLILTAARTNFRATRNKTSKSLFSIRCAWRDTARLSNVQLNNLQI